jgi:uncharacterized protein with NAD-binding domain and iron-sulfur cluster
MDRQFIEQIYEALYEDPEGEFGKDNSSYANAVRQSYREIDKAEKMAKTYDEQMVAALQKMLDAMAVQAHFSIRLAYLRGAEDREKMLRI